MQKYFVYYTLATLKGVKRKKWEVKRLQLLIPQSPTYPL